MSHAPIDRKRNSLITPILMAQALRQDYRQKDSAVKQIARVTGVHPTTARKWYDGENLPLLPHVMTLVKSSPTIRDIVLAELAHSSGKTQLQHLPESAQTDVYTDMHVSINLRLPRRVLATLNGRQLWFLGQMQQSTAVTATDLVAAWAVSTRTAWRDIRGLQTLGVIIFLGARKNGGYVLRPQEGLMPRQDSKEGYESQLEPLNSLL